MYQKGNTMKTLKTNGLVQIRLDLDTYKRLKIYCVEAEMKLRDAVEQAIKEYLDKGDQE